MKSKLTESVRRSGSWSRRAALCALLSVTCIGTAMLVPSAAFAAEKSKIGIIGAGRIGSAMARLWVKAGHPVMVSSRKPEELKPLAEELLFGKLEHGGVVKITTEGEGEDQKLAFEYLPADPAARQAKIKAEEEDDDDDVVDDDPPADALVGASPKRSLSGPKKPTGAVPSVPRRRKDD